MTHIEVHDHALALGVTVEDLFVVVPPAAPAVQQRQKHAGKNHSYLWVFRRGRQKTRCGVVGLKASAPAGWGALGSP